METVDLIVFDRWFKEHWFTAISQAVGIFNWRWFSPSIKWINLIQEHNLCSCRISLFQFDSPWDDGHAKWSALICYAGCLVLWISWVSQQWHGIHSLIGLKHKLESAGYLSINSSIESWTGFNFKRCDIFQCPEGVFSFRLLIQFRCFFTAVYKQ